VHPFAPAHLVTLRRGERVHDPMRDALVPLEEEIVKVRGRGNTWTCVFLVTEDNTCGIYARRPRECELLACWDPTPLAQAYQEGRLTRQELLPPDHPMLELAREHDARCDCRDLAGWARAVREQAPDREAAEASFLEAVRYDGALRQVVQEKAGLDPAALDFYLGRPVHVLAKAWGLSLRRDADGTLRLALP
jgi:hypothetical protein